MPVAYEADSLRNLLRTDLREDMLDRGAKLGKTQRPASCYRSIEHCKQKLLDTEDR